MTQEQAASVICHYHVKPGHESEFEALLAVHWPALHGAGLTTDTPPQIFRGKASGKPDDQHGAQGLYIEIFQWNRPDAPGMAHQLPEVMAVWEPMGALCSKMDFPSFDSIDPIGA